MMDVDMKVRFYYFEIYFIKNHLITILWFQISSFESYIGSFEFKDGIFPLKEERSETKTSNNKNDICYMNITP